MHAKIATHESKIGYLEQGNFKDIKEGDAIFSDVAMVYSCEEGCFNNKISSIKGY